MNRKTILILVGLVMAFGLGIAVAYRTTNPPNTVIPRDVIAGGGGRSATSPPNYILQSTIGQPAAGISTAGNQTTLVGGFQVMVPRGPAAAQRWNLY